MKQSVEPESIKTLALTLSETMTLKRSESELAEGDDIKYMEGRLECALAFERLSIGAT